MNDSSTRVAREVTTLALPALVRVVTELDDNGPVAKGMLQRTCPDLPRTQLRYAVEAARDRGLVRAHGPRYQLTAAGVGLADLYDATARWARAHQVPLPVSDFVTRVRSTLQLLARLPDGAWDAHRTGERAGALVEAGLVTDIDAAVSLLRLHSSLTVWIAHNPRALGSPAAHVAAEAEHAA